MTLHSVAEILWQAAPANQNNYTPTLPPLGLIAWIISYTQRRNPIGGWLLFYYWQLYSSVLMTLVFFAINIDSYVPENFQSIQRFLLFLAGAALPIVLLLIQAAVATLLLTVRTWDMLTLLRWVQGAALTAGVLATVIYAAYFPENVPLGLISTLSDGVWLAYLFRSARVRHVFLLHDWDVVVNSIHPPRPAAPRVVPR